MDINTSNKRDQNYFDFLLLQYQVLSDQQLNHNSLVWNTPSLLFVAQAFLWGIALSSETEGIIRCCVALASAMIGFASVHGFSRNRLMEIADCRQLSIIEEYMTSSLNPLVLTSHCQLSNRTIIRYGKSTNLVPKLKKEGHYKWRPLNNLRTFVVWEVILWFFLGLSVALFIYNVYLLVH